MSQRSFPEDQGGEADGLRKRAENAWLSRASRPEVPVTTEEWLRLKYELEVHQIELEMQNKELLQIQDDLERARSRYFSLYELAPVGYLTLNAGGMILEANLTIANLLDMPRSQLLGKAFTGFIEKLDQDTHDFYFCQLDATGVQQAYEVRMRGRNSVLFWAHIDIARHLESPGDGTTYRVVVHDIDVHKRAELALQQSEEKFARLFHSSPAGVAVLRMDNGRFIDVNAAYTSLSGYGREELLGRTMAEVGLFTPEIWAEIDARMKQGTLLRNFEIELTTQSGASRCCLFSSDMVDLPVGPCIQTCIVDITVERRLGDELKQSETRYRLLFENMAEGFALLEVPTDEFDLANDLRYLVANRVYAGRSGLPEDSLIGKSLRTVMPDEDIRAIEPYARQALAGTPAAAQIYSRPSGRHLRYHLYSPQPRMLAAIVEDITARVEAEVALRESEHKYRDLYDHSPDMYLSSDARTNLILDCNLTLARTLGYPAQQLAGQPLGMIFEHASFARVVETRPQYAASKQLQNLEVQLRRKDGTLLDVLMSAALEPEQAGKSAFSRITFHDVSEHRRMEAALQASEERFRTMFLEAPLGIALIDSLTAQVVEVNPRFAAIAGRSREEMATIDWIQITHPDDVQADLDNMALLNAGKISGFQMTKRYIHPDGTPVWISMTIAPLTVEDKSKPRHLCMIEDITERKQLEEALRQREERLRMIIENSPDVIWGWDQDGNLQFVSQALQTHYGIAPEWMLQAAADLHALAAQVPAAERTAERNQALGAPDLGFGANWLQAQQAVLYCAHNPGEKLEQEGRLAALDDSVMYVHNTYQGFRGNAPGVEVVSITHNVTPVVRAREELQRALQQLKLATDAAGIGFWTWNFADDSIEWDERIYELYAVPPTKRGLVHEIWRARLHPDDVAPNEVSLAEAQRTGSDWDSTFRIVLPDGRTRYIYSAAAVERDAAGEPVRMIGINRDVTDQKLYEQILQDAAATLEQRVAERTAQLQETAAELARANAGKDAFMAAISHELRTPLTGVLSMAEVLELGAKGPLTEQQLRYVGMIQSSGQRLLDLVDGVLLYTSLMGGKVPVQRGPCRLADLSAASIRGFAEEAAKKGQVIAVEVEPLDLAIVSDPDLILRTLNLLLDNAIKFTPQGGALGVQVVRVPAAGAVHLAVWDTGIGIEPEILPHLFDPFTQVDQTLARRFEGVGIGLATVRKLVDLLGGSVSVESEPGTGSRFTVTLPA